MPELVHVLEMVKPIRLNLVDEYDPNEPIKMPSTVRFNLSLVFKDEFSDDIVAVYREELL